MSKKISDEELANAIGNAAGLLKLIPEVMDKITKDVNKVEVNTSSIISDEFIISSSINGKLEISKENGEHKFKLGKIPKDLNISKKVLKKAIKKRNLVMPVIDTLEEGVYLTSFRFMISDDFIIPCILDIREQPFKKDDLKKDFIVIAPGMAIESFSNPSKLKKKELIPNKEVRKWIKKNCVFMDHDIKNKPILSDNYLLLNTGEIFYICVPVLKTELE